jgi:hypothetical protein
MVVDEHHLAASAVELAKARRLATAAPRQR